MRSSIPIMLPLQLICIFYFIFLLLLPALISTHLIAKTGCQDHCGNLSIPYPFGIGSKCSFNSSFTISCDTSTIPPKAYLPVLNATEVIEINETYIRVKSPNLVSVCYDLPDYERANATSVPTESYKLSMSVNLSGTAYMLSELNSITAIGCDDMLLEIRQSNGSYVASGCSALCLGRNYTGGVGYCPLKATSLSNGCCQALITGDTDFLQAELVDLSGKLLHRKLFPCSYAFIQEETHNATVFSYPLYYLHNSTAFLNDNWASASRPPVVRLDWSFGSENCSLAQQNNNTYACQDSKSVCVDADDDYSVNSGYICKCVEGYEGNPYLPGGCTKISLSGSIAQFGCPDQCGNLSIPYPFGVGKKHCYSAPSFEIICNASTNPPIAYLRTLNAEIIELNSSQVLVYYPFQPGFVCYDFSDNYQRRVSKREKRDLKIDLSFTQYTLSEENLIVAAGCDDMVVAVSRQANRSTSIGSGCATICSDRRRTNVDYVDDFGSCPYGETVYWPGDGCCMAPVPRGTGYLEANFIDLSGEWPPMNFSCSYAFVRYKGTSIVRLNMNDSTEILASKEVTRLALDWRIGAVVNCEVAQQRDPANFACKTNSHCVDFDATIGGYLCNCSEGYQGNPYLTHGCQDINECADNATYPCISKSICINTDGSFICLCPKGYYGDGRKDGTGCIQRPQTKLIILIGIGSGLGFLLLLLMCFWLYKVLQKRKERLLKEKFFKRNGGLLLQQQMNEGTLGNTKVFPANELEVATDQFNASRIIGQGAQGTVYKGMLTDGKIVAIKRSKLVEEDQLQQFINEVAILSQINHRNVVRLLGCCLETEVPLLVYEYMPNGTLFQLIHDPDNEFPFPWSMRLKIAADIAGALAYLHSASSIPIYHRDIKSSNLLLDEKYVVKVSDFGTSRSVASDQTHLTTMVKGTFGYLDPEYFQSSQFTEKSDVYSFGVVLVELLTGQRPISFNKAEEQRGLATRFLTCMEENCLDTILDPQVSEQGRMEEVILVARLAQRCLNLKGRMRPAMKEVATELESVRMSQMSDGVRDESEEVRGLVYMPTTISDTDYTWTGSYKSVGASSSDTHPLIYQE